MFAVAALVALAGAAQASAATLTVCQSGPPACGYSGIQAAVNAANSGDTIKVAAGTYSGFSVPGTNPNTTSVTLTGAVAGNTVIDEHGGTNIAVFITGDGSVKLGGVTITGALGQGGIDNLGGTLTLNNSVVTANNDPFGVGGGGITNGGTLTLNNSTVTRNTTDNSGGGISNQGTVTLNSSTVSNNTGVGGGGISNQGTVTLNNSTVSSNVAFDSSGGGIGTAGGTVTLNSSTVSNNTAAGVGGGILASFGTLTLNKSQVTGNTADSGGGGGIWTYNGGTLANSTVTGNTQPLTQASTTTGRR